MNSTKIAIVNFGCPNAKRIFDFAKSFQFDAHLFTGSEMTKQQIQGFSGVILSGGPGSVCEENHPDFEDQSIYDVDIPILGICYGAQLLVQREGGTISRNLYPEFGSTEIQKVNSSVLFRQENGNDFAETLETYMSHNDSITSAPPEEGWKITAVSDADSNIAALEKGDTRFAVQFHPEVSNCTMGNQILKNFLYFCSSNRINSS